MHANAPENVLHRDTDPNVMAYLKEVKEDSKRENMVAQKVLKEAIRKEEREKNSLAALVAYEATKSA